jgi:hypothetical protein
VVVAVVAVVAAVAAAAVVAAVVGGDGAGIVRAATGNGRATGSSRT